MLDTSAEKRQIFRERIAFKWPHFGELFGRLESNPDSLAGTKFQQLTDENTLPSPSRTFNNLQDLPKNGKCSDVGHSGLKTADFQGANCVQMAAF